MKNVKSMFTRKPAHQASDTQTPATADGISPRPSGSYARPIQEPEYKLSSVSPEGTFIPPSPPEKTSFLSRFRPGGGGTNHAAPDIKTDEDSAGFVIPRASFDGYRRSFDIRPSMDGNDSASVRSSANNAATGGRPSRQSLDLLTAPQADGRRSSYSYSRKDPGLLAQLAPANGLGGSPRPSTTGSGRSVPAMQPLPTAALETEFEEVKLNDDEEDDKDIKKKRFWQRTTKNNDASGAELKALGVNEET